MVGNVTFRIKIKFMIYLSLVKDKETGNRLRKDLLRSEGKTLVNYMALKNLLMLFSELQTRNESKKEHVFCSIRRILQVQKIYIRLANNNSSIYDLNVIKKSHR